MVVSINLFKTSFEKKFKYLKEVDKIMTSFPINKKYKIKIEKDSVYVPILRREFKIDKKLFIGRMDKWYNNLTYENMAPVIIKYAMLNEFLQCGNQYSTFLPYEMEALRGKYQIEIFGSALNSHLDYYGCIEGPEAPFGGLGNYKRLMK